MFVFGIVLLLSLVSSSCNETIVSKEKYTWRDAMEFCGNRSAHLISSDTALQSHLNSSDVVWTSNTITVDRNCREASRAKLCGFTFSKHAIGYREGFTLFGDCNALHLVACHSLDNMPFYVKSCTYNEAMECKYTLSPKLTLWLQTGYYWTKRALFYCTQQITEFPGILNVEPNIRRFCGVYGKDFGQAFGNCSDINFAICTSDTNNAVIADGDLSMMIGVPVGVCLVLVCGVILGIVFVRRGRKGRESKSGKKHIKLKMCDNNTSQTSGNVSQSEPVQSVDNTVRIGYNNQQRQSETNNGYEYLRKTEAGFINEEHEYADARSTERDEEIDSSSDDLDNTGFCFAKHDDYRTGNNGENFALHIYANEYYGQTAAVKT